MSPEQRFLIHSYDKEAVIYDRLSGDTHYLNALAYARLQGLSQEEIATRVELANSQGLGDSLKAIDDQFRAWGLID